MCNNQTNFKIFAAAEEDAERIHQIPPHAYRTEFQRDRDRILYSREFRRLSGKTQIFAVNYDDNMRNRLTHTLEVSQIATTIAKKVGLNESLAEAIALGHDVGHTPFGHIGERVLNYIMNGCIDHYDYGKNLSDGDKGFKHNLQGARVVCKLEDYFSEDDGLNLTKYTIWGIVNHTDLAYKKCPYFNAENGLCTYKNKQSPCETTGRLSTEYYKTFLKRLGSPIIRNDRDWTFEAIIVSIADEIAQRHHDIEDGIYSKTISPDALEQQLSKLFVDKKDEIEALFKTGSGTGFEGKTKQIKSIGKFVVNTYVDSYIEYFEKSLEKLMRDYKISCHKDFLGQKSEIWVAAERDKGLKKHFGFNEEFLSLDSVFSDFLKNCILRSHLAQTMDGKAAYILNQLFKAFLTNPQQLPDATVVKIVYSIEPDFLVKNSKKSSIEIIGEARSSLNAILKNGGAKEKNILMRTICDYLAGMTDNYAYQEYEKLYGHTMMHSLS